MGRSGILRSGTPHRRRVDRSSHQISQKMIFIESWNIDIMDNNNMLILLFKYSSILAVIYVNKQVSETD